MRRRFRWRWVALAVTLLALALVGDWWQSNREMGNLLTAVEASEKSMNQANTALDGAASAANVDTTTDEGRAALIAAFKTACSDGAARVQETGAGVEDVSILPWHDSLDEAKARYLQHSAVWVREYRACAKDPTTLTDKAMASEINATFRIAHTAFRHAEPLWPQHKAPERIEAIFKG